jgi:hypothetical protein
MRTVTSREMPELPTITKLQLDTVLEPSDVVVTGVGDSGDCGGCSACSTTDALLYVERAVPPFTVATRPFEYLVDATDRQYGLAGLHRLYVDHPIWTRDASWFEACGRRLADEWAQAMSVGSVGNREGSSDTIPSDDPFYDMRRILNADNFSLHVARDALVLEYLRSSQLSPRMPRGSWVLPKGFCR